MKRNCIRDGAKEQRDLDVWEEGQEQPLTGSSRVNAILTHGTCTVVTLGA
jgi:hypothetical protein